MRAIDSFQNDDERYKQQFKKVSVELVALLSKEGVKTKAFRDDALPHFSVLKAERKISVITALEVYHELCAEHLGEGQALRDSKRFTWRILVKLGLAPLSDLLNKIADGDIVEIYGCDNTQIFRNLEFFDVCSYTLEELFCVEWFRLFDRDSSFTALMNQVVNDLLSHKYPEGVEAPLPEHIVTEILSDEKVQSNFFMKVMAPLYKNKQITAFICIERGTPINPRA